VWGLGVEVVSNFELEAALRVGFQRDKILVNGIGKRHWLKDYCLPRLIVHFDSVAETRELARTAYERSWTIGLRCAIPKTVRGDDQVKPEKWDQFGMTREELRESAMVLMSEGVVVSGLHFHLGTNVQLVSEYADAVAHLAESADYIGLQPKYVDVGGGLPLPSDCSTIHGRPTRGQFDLQGFRELLSAIPRSLPSASEVWLENGRFLSGSSGAVVVRVLDKKFREGATYLICDGGRVNHARVAAFGAHEILTCPTKPGRKIKTFVCGPTCGSVDRLGCWDLPESIEPGDLIVWLAAGAYHIPLETRFSFGVAPVVWVDRGGELRVVRAREKASAWLGQWEAPCDTAPPASQEM
jgi:diaminopimelate decarboxylase